MKILRAATASAVVASVSLLGWASACSSGSGDGGNAGKGFSCVIMTTDSMSCVDYSGGADTMGARNSCTGTVTEGARCPTAGVSGICSFAENGGTSRLFYYNADPGGIAVLQKGCTDAHGTWSTG